MTSPLIRWPLLEPVIVRWVNNAACVMVKGSLVYKVQCHCHPVVFWLFCILPVIGYGSSSDNNLTFAGYTLHCPKKCSYRTCCRILPNFSCATCSESVLPKLKMIFGVTAQWRTWEGKMCTAALFISFIVTVFVRISREFRIKQFVYELKQLTQWM